MKGPMNVGRRDLRDCRMWQYVVSLDTNSVLLNRKKRNKRIYNLAIELDLEGYGAIFYTFIYKLMTEETLIVLICIIINQVCQRLPAFNIRHLRPASSSFAQLWKGTLPMLLIGSSNEKLLRTYPVIKFSRQIVASIKYQPEKVYVHYKNC